MQWDDVERNWPAMIGPITTRWPDVTEEDLIALTPTRVELVDTVRTRTGEAPAEAERQVAEWLEGPMPADAYADPAHDNAAAMDAGRYVPEGEDALADDQRFGDDDVPDRPIGRQV